MLTLLPATHQCLTSSTPRNLPSVPHAQHFWLPSIDYVFMLIARTNRQQHPYWDMQMQYTFLRNHLNENKIGQIKSIQQGANTLLLLPSYTYRAPSQVAFHNIHSTLFSGSDQTDQDKNNQGGPDCGHKNSFRAKGRIREIIAGKPSTILQSELVADSPSRSTPQCRWAME